MLSNKKVIFVDDKAAAGWGELLRTIIGDSQFEEIIPAQHETDMALAKRVEQFIEKNGQWTQFVRSNHVYVTDLKLLETEREATDYTKLLSYRTIQRLRPIGKDGLRDARLRTLYFTASNDLSKVKGMLQTKGLNPHLIFTKEGADQLLDENESFLKYLELLRALTTLLSPTPRKKLLTTLSALNLQEEHEKLVSSYEYLLLLHEDLVAAESNEKMRFSDDLEEAEAIYLDTNIITDIQFGLPLIRLIRGRTDKIRIADTVRHEVKIISENVGDQRGLEHIGAAFFYELMKKLDLAVDSRFLTDLQDRIISSGSIRYGRDFADEHLITLMSRATTPVVLVSNDNDLVGRIEGLGNPFAKVRRDIRLLSMTEGNAAPPFQVFIVNSIYETPNADSFVFAPFRRSPMQVRIRKTELSSWNLQALTAFVSNHQMKISTNASAPDILQALSTSA